MRGEESLALREEKSTPRSPRVLGSDRFKTFSYPGETLERKIDLAPSERKNLAHLLEKRRQRGGVFWRLCLAASRGKRIELSEQGRKREKKERAAAIGGLLYKRKAQSFSLDRGKRSRRS